METSVTLTLPSHWKHKPSLSSKVCLLFFRVFYFREELTCVLVVSWITAFLKWSLVSVFPILCHETPPACLDPCWLWVEEDNLLITADSRCAAFMARSENTQLRRKCKNYDCCGKYFIFLWKEVRFFFPIHVYFVFFPVVKGNLS